MYIYLQNFYPELLLKINPSLFLVACIIANVIAYPFFKAKINADPKKRSVYLLVSWITLFLYPIFLFPAYFYASRNISKPAREIGKNVWSEIQVAPTEELVDQFIELTVKFGIKNEPVYWNKVRGIWFIVNDCPTISTEKKTQFRNFLMAQGLMLVGKDKEVNDNYSK